MGCVRYRFPFVTAQVESTAGQTIHGHGFQTQLERRLASTPFAGFILRYEPLAILLIFALFWSGLLIYSGTLTSGYHLIDDWEMLEIRQDLSESSLPAVVAETLRMDLTIRLRPWYYVHRVFSLWLLG